MESAPKAASFWMYSPVPHLASVIFWKPASDNLFGRRGMQPAYRPQHGGCPAFSSLFQEEIDYANVSRHSAFQRRSWGQNPGDRVRAARSAGWRCGDRSLRRHGVAGHRCDEQRRASWPEFLPADRGVRRTAVCCRSDSGQFFPARRQTQRASHSDVPSGRPPTAPALSQGHAQRSAGDRDGHRNRRAEPDGSAGDYRRVSGIGDQRHSVEWSDCRHDDRVCRRRICGQPNRRTDGSQRAEPGGRRHRGQHSHGRGGCQ